MSKLRKEYHSLEIKIQANFDALLIGGREFKFIDAIDLLEDVPANEDDRLEELLQNGELNSLPTVERRGLVSGNVIDTHIISVSKDGLWVLDSDGGVEDGKLIGFKALADLRDKMDLIDAMTELLFENPNLKVNL